MKYFFQFPSNKSMAETDGVNQFTLVSQTVIEWRAQHILPDCNRWPSSLYLQIQGISCKYFFLLGYTWWTALPKNKLLYKCVVNMLHTGIYVGGFHLFLSCYSYGSGSLYLRVSRLPFDLIQFLAVHKLVFPFMWTRSRGNSYPLVATVCQVLL